MQAVSQSDGGVIGFSVDRPAAGRNTLSPAAMAHYLRRVDPLSALCFAEAMYEGAAWANEAGGAYWAAVVRLV